MVNQEIGHEAKDADWQSLKDGKTEALSNLFHNQYKSLFQYGQKLTNYNTELTKEIIQELFFKIWERRTSLGDVQSVKVYLFTAFRRELIDKARHVDVEENYLASLNLYDSWEKSPEDIFLFNENQYEDSKKLRIAMDKLPKRIKEAINLRYFEEMGYREIAEIMNLKERTVYNFVHEGLTFLRKELAILLVFLNL
jgi:RNA polymerase sigma factor (sigma-70 family)